MSKYQPLEDFLNAASTNEVPMTFGEIESIIEAPLPPVARKHRAWWSNNPSNSVITKAWLDAGYKTERVDMAGERLVFRKVADQPQGVAEAPAAAFKPAAKQGFATRFQMAFEGTLTLAPGFDPTEPTGEVWEAEQG
jgi:hypothetical protein